MSFTGRTARMQVGDSATPGRPEADFYRTCPEAVHALLAVEPFEGLIWEPACGDGAISKILIDHGKKVYSSDLYDYGYGESDRDFLITSVPDGVMHIITNPPFKLSAQFARRGVPIIRKYGGKLALLNRLLWLEGVARKELFADTGLSRVWVFSRRLPMMHRPGYKGKRTTPMVAFAWYVWDACNESDKTEVDWIDWRDHAPDP